MKNTICALPWTHLNIIPRGKVYPCCITTDFNGYAGDLNTQTIEEVWNSDYMKQVRVKMMNGEEPSMCSRCFESERSSGTSTRINHNNYFKSKLAEIPIITQSDGFVEKLTYVIGISDLVIYVIISAAHVVRSTQVLGLLTLKN